MALKLILYIFILICLKCVCGTIYQLNVTEYNRMPALYDLDNYDICMEQEEAVFCLLKVEVYAEPGNRLMSIIDEYTNDINRHYNHRIVERGVCVKTKCSRFINGRDLNDETQLDCVLQQCVNNTFLTTHGLQAKVAAKLYCNVKGEKEEVTLLDRSFLSAVAVLLFAVIIGTAYDEYLEIYQKQNEGNPYVLSFSLKRNWKRLIYIEPENNGLVYFHSLHATRTFNNFLTLTVHAGFIYTVGFQKNYRDVEQLYYDAPFTYVFTNGLSMVQIFFYMSGLLLAYNVMIYSAKHIITWKYLPIAVFRRFMRLAPSMGMVIWFSATWLRHLGSGPFWKLHTTTSVTLDCQKYWWTHLLYINNYVPENKRCYLQTWQIAADTQMFIMGLALLIATLKGGRNCAMIAVLVLGTLFPAINIWLTNFNAIVLLSPECFRSLGNDEFFYYHIRTHNNLQNYVMGMAAGIFVYKYQLKGKDFSRNKWYGWSQLITCPVYAYFFYLGHVFYDEEKPSLASRVFLAAIYRLILGILNTWLVLGLLFRAPGVLTQIVKCRAWVLTSRLTYCVYLIHMHFIHIVLASRRHVSETRLIELLLIYLGLITLSYLMAVGLYLTVEAPFNVIAKILTTPSRRQALSKTNEEDKQNKNK